MTPDSEFKGRTWAQEWQRRIDHGILQAANVSSSEHVSNIDNIPENTRITPMERLTEMSRRSLLNDINLVAGFENVFSKILKDFETELETGKIDYQKLKALTPLYLSAKERFFMNIDKIKELEMTCDSELLYGREVMLKDPQARERVRKCILSFMNLAHQQSLMTDSPESTGENDINKKRESDRQLSG